MSDDVFPKPIRRLPEADMPVEGVKAFLSQADNHQVVFMEFDRDVDIPEHSHEAQWEIVLEGKVDLNVEGKQHKYKRGDRFFIPKNVRHSAKVYKGYASFVYFDQKERYKRK